MKKLKSILLLSIISISFLSCSNDEDDINTAQKDVYVCGHENYFPAYWKNNTVNQLENNGKIGSASSIKVFNNDVFCLGGLNNDTSGDDISYYIWKNNSIFITLNEGFIPQDFAVDGDDIYVIGLAYNPQFGHYQGKLWKNGVLSNLTSTGKESFTSITIANHDVYVAGFIYEGNNSYAAYWKNNTQTLLTDGTKDCYVNTIEVFENNVYVTGSEKNPSNVSVAKYWKNGVPTSLTNGNYDATAGAIRFKNNDIYVNGVEFNSAGDGILKYWKNGAETILTNGTYYHPVINSMEIINNKITSIGYSDDYANTASLFQYDGVSLLTKFNCGFNDLCIN
ncbi:hypothetical protein NAT51_04165 [Flavobacterium amniphilum]|uniref:hypothetical protein n=1 Tax=Flavobacterium amniphilum TaxID=1834035 RepID=UPI00202A1A06|nr:hypothetical protein [Flavobacterium amniphilum]MCL9804703.1 hypothetical protein [Flavobacterium amniphilum]